jgi:hypothetical protein
MQKRMVVTRMARSTTRIGRNASTVTTAVRSVLDEYLPGQQRRTGRPPALLERGAARRSSDRMRASQP